MFEHFNFQESLILFLIGALFFKDQIVVWWKSKYGVKSDKEDLENPPNIVDLTREMKRLSAYYNHETTGTLNRIVTLQEKHLNDNQELRDTMKDISRTLGEMKEYGIRCRETE